MQLINYEELTRDSQLPEHVKQTILALLNTKTTQTTTTYDIVAGEKIPTKVVEVDKYRNIADVIAIVDRLYPEYLSRVAQARNVKHMDDADNSNYLQGLIDVEG